MTRWLLVNELGGGLGHLVRLRRLASALVRPGDRLTVAAPDVDLARILFRGLADDVVPPPEPAQVRDQPWPGFAGILDAFGFARPDAVHRMTVAWQRRFRDVRTDAIVADFAPFASFSARGAIPVAQIGSGFDLPGAGRRGFMPFTPKESAGPERLVLRTMQRVARRLGLPVPSTLPQAVGGDMRILAGLPWIDPFDGRRQERAIGPLGRRAQLMPAPSEGHVFAYLDPGSPSFDPLVRALAHLPVRRSAYWHGGAPAVRQLLADRGVTLFDSPPDLVTLLPETTLVVSHGGAGLVADALFAGRPHMCLPGHREAALNASALVETGAGVVPSDHHPETLHWALTGALNHMPMRDRALEMGEAAHARFGRDPVHRVAAAIRRLV